MISPVPKQPNAGASKALAVGAQKSVARASRTPLIADQHFPRHARLLNGHDFQLVFKGTNCRSSDQLLTVLAIRNEQDQARLGLAISKRFIKTAVGRNRVKRLIRDSFRRHQALLIGLDIVVMNRVGALTASNQALTKALEAHWRRVAKRCVKS